VFVLERGEDGSARVLFGDGLRGSKPAVAHGVWDVVAARYRHGGGGAGHAGDVSGPPV
jgi:hypothetical protein